MEIEFFFQIMTIFEKRSDTNKPACSVGCYDRARLISRVCEDRKNFYCYTGLEDGSLVMRVMVKDSALKLVKLAKAGQADRDDSDCSADMDQSERYFFFKITPQISKPI